MLKQCDWHVKAMWLVFICVCLMNEQGHEGEKRWEHQYLKCQQRAGEIKAEEKDRRESRLSCKNTAIKKMTTKKTD